MDGLRTLQVTLFIESIAKKYGDIITFSIGKEPNFWEDNWYKVLSGAALAVGIYAAVKK